MLEALIHGPLPRGWSQPPIGEGPYRSRSAHQTMVCMCAGRRFPGEHALLLMSLKGLRLRAGCACGRPAPMGSGQNRQATPRFGMPRSASRRVGMCTPMPPSAGGSLVHRSLRTASVKSITYVMAVTYTFSDFARPPISSTVLNRLSRALRGRERRQPFGQAVLVPAREQTVARACVRLPGHDGAGENGCGTPQPSDHTALVELLQ